MANITSIEEFEDLVSEAVVKPLVIEYTAEWCPSCKALKPFVNAIEAKSLNDKAFDLRIIDIDEIPELVELEDIDLIPSLKVYYKGEAVEYEGPMKPSRLAAFITELTGK